MATHHWQNTSSAVLFCNNFQSPRLYQVGGHPELFGTRRLVPAMVTATCMLEETIEVGS